jgi:hypothetical protein
MGNSNSAHVFVVCSAATSPGLWSIHFRLPPRKLSSWPAPAACQSNVIGDERGSSSGSVLRGVESLGSEGVGHKVSCLGLVVIDPSALAVEGLDDAGVGDEVGVVLASASGVADSVLVRSLRERRGDEVLGVSVEPSSDST